MLTEDKNSKEERASQYNLAWDRSLTVVSESLRTGGKIADAIEAGLNYYRETDWYNGLNDKKDFEDKYISHMQEELKAQEKTARHEVIGITHKETSKISEELGINSAITAPGDVKEYNLVDDTITFQQFRDFLQQPGINAKGIFDEAKVTAQPIYRCIKAEKLPGKKTMAKLVPILKKYGLNKLLSIQRVKSEVFDKAMYKMDPDLDPNNSDIYKQPDYAGAIKDFSTVIEMDAEHSEAYHWRGFTKYLLKDYQAALEDYAFAIKFDPNNANIYRGRGYAKIKANDLSGALNDFTIAIEADPKDRISYRDRAELKNELGDYNGAIKDYTISIQINPGTGLDYFDRGNLKIKIGDITGACADWQKAAESGIESALDRLKQFRK